MSELLKLIQEGESGTLDFKLVISDQKRIARTLVAFANCEGGTLLIGVKDNGKVAGCDPSEEYHMISAAAELYTFPKVNFESQVYQEGNKLVLAINVLPSALLHEGLSEDGQKRTFIRIHDETVQCNKILHRLWQLRKRNVKCEIEFDNDTQLILDLLKTKGRLSLSQVYKYSGLDKKVVDRKIIDLLLGKVVYFAIAGDSIVYFITEPDQEQL